MGVDVDEAGRDEGAVGIDLVPGRSVDADAPVIAADVGDHPVGDGDVGDATGSPGAVHDRAAADDQIVHRAPPRVPATRRTVS